MPAAGAFPRLLADGPQLARAMALSGTVLTTARLAGTALGGVAVALLALQGVVLVAVVGYLAVLLLVWSVRVPAASPPEKAGRPQPVRPGWSRRPGSSAPWRSACSSRAWAPGLLPADRSSPARRSPLRARW